MKITKYTLEDYDTSINLHKKGFGSQRIAKILGHKSRSTIEGWINKGRKPYYFSEKRISSSNSRENIERMRAMNKTTQPRACKMAAELKTKKLKKGYGNISKEFAYVLGTIYGDGHVSIKQRRIILSAIDKDFVLNLKANLENWCGLKARFYIRTIRPDKFIKNRKPQWVCYVDSIKAARFLKRFNIKRIINCNNLIKYEFIKGIFDSEGSASVKGEINIYNTNKSLIKLINSLLFDLGIKTSVHSHTYFNALTHRDLTMFKINILSNSRFFFAKNIGSSIERKQIRLAKFINNNTLLDINSNNWR